MHKFFVSENNIFSDMAMIEGEDVKHIYKVLRLKEGDKVNINDCNGNEFLGTIDYIDKSKVEVKLLEELKLNNEPPIEVYLYQGLPKASKMDLIVQKCTELGIREITPIVTDRVASSINDIKRESKKLDRWNRIAFEACKQNKRTLIPKVKDIMSMDELKEQLKEMDLIVVPYENAENYGIKQMIKNIKSEVKKVGIIIGPEGGFEQEEIEGLKNMEAQIVTLGPRILRTETAGFTCLALLMYELGDLGGVS